MSPTKWSLWDLNLKTFSIKFTAISSIIKNKRFSFNNNFLNLIIIFSIIKITKLKKKNYLGYLSLYFFSSLQILSYTLTLALLNKIIIFLQYAKVFLWPFYITYKFQSNTSLSYGWACSEPRFRYCIFLKKELK